MAPPPPPAPTSPPVAAAGDCDGPSIPSSCLQLDFLTVEQGDCASTQAVDNQFSFQNQFWRAHAKLERHFSLLPLCEQGGSR